MTLFLGFSPRQHPFPIGEDDDNRVIISCNYDVNLRIQSGDLWEVHVSDLLHSKGLGAIGSTLFIGPNVKLPPDPTGEDETPLIVINNTGGLSPLVPHVGTITERPTLQVAVRSINYLVAMSTAISIRDFLVSVRNKHVTS